MKCSAGYEPGNERPVTFILVNHNGSEVLKPCIESIMSQEPTRVSIVLVDNGSRDDSVRMVRSTFPDVNIITLGRNLGFAKAVNAGLAQVKDATAEYIAFVNSDVTLDPQWASCLVDYMENSGYGCVQSLIMKHEQRGLIDSAGIGVSRSFDVYDRENGRTIREGREQGRAIFGPCYAAAIFTPRAVNALTASGAFLDEAFNSFYEDVECSFRANTLGLRSGLLLRPLCWHRRSFTADRLPVQKHLLIGRNYFLFLARHIPPGMVLRSIPSITYRRGLLLCRMLRHPLLFLCCLAGSASGVLGLLGTWLARAPGRAGKSTCGARVLKDLRDGVYE